MALSMFQAFKPRADFCVYLRTGPWFDAMHEGVIASVNLFSSRVSPIFLAAHMNAIVKVLEISGLKLCATGSLCEAAIASTPQPRDKTHCQPHFALCATREACNIPLTRMAFSRHRARLDRMPHASG